MIGFVKAVASLFATAVVLYSLAALVKPFWFVTKRWQAVLLGLVGLVVVGLLNPASNRPGDPSPSGTRPTAPTANAPSASLTGASQVKSDLEAQTASLDQTRRRLEELAKPCELAFERAANTHGKVSGYAVTSEAEQACRKSASAILQLRHDDIIPEAAREDLDKGLQCYGFAVGQRAGALGEAKQVLDGDQRPSKVLEVRSLLADANQRIHECDVQYLAAKLSHGYQSQAAREIIPAAKPKSAHPQ